jgi:hypothetical protein
VQKKVLARLEQYNLTRATLDITPNDNSFHDAMDIAFQYCQENHQEFQKQVITALFDAQQDEHVDDCNEAEWDGLVNRICKAINDNSLLLNGKDKLVQADDCIA